MYHASIHLKKVNIQNIALHLSYLTSFFLIALNKYAVATIPKKAWILSDILTEKYIISSKIFWNKNLASNEKASSLQR